ncbi:carbohydrate ABC transporter permease [Fodinicola acaciae]|uniref:carbohydrate ABC transporter permease n=1 Tax=Fodinicola acaciae TaxID=2681555 RepID=UPI0013D190A4|nr:sugar ABC transporter permease [Fodinicola acaciae]
MTTITAPPPATAIGKGANRRQGVGRLAAGLVSPTFLVLLLVIVYPLLDALRLAFYQKNTGIDPTTGFVQSGSTFVGLKNFLDLFRGDTGAAFLNSLLNTTTFTIVGVVIETVIGVGMALVMHKAFRGRGLVRASILVPWAIPTAISALLWKWIFAADGIANGIIGTKVLWTTEGLQAWFAVLIADTWKTAPFIGLLVLAGLQIIPAEVYEAARVDGSNAWNTFWRITLPLVKPALIVAILFRMLDVLRLFDLPYVLTGGDNANTQTLSILAFNEAIKGQRFGAAGAISTMLFIYIAVAAFVFVKVLGADVIGTRLGRKS